MTRALKSPCSVSQVLPTASFSGMVVQNHAFYYVMQIMNNGHYTGHRCFLQDSATGKMVWPSEHAS